MDEVFGDAFVPHGRVIRRPERPTGPTVAVKDLFDWAGVPTGAGNPDWLRTHPVPAKDAGVLTTLLAGGATLYGKTVTDELAYSIHGDNGHYGTPPNPAAPDRVPGGSSSGSASAVAAGVVDAALGTDTGGSVRVPAAYCGLYGIRTTHGAVDRSGLVALAPSFDTVGWFARSPETLADLGRLLLPPSAPVSWTACAMLVPSDSADEALGVEKTLARIGLPRIDLVPLVEAHGGLEALRLVYVCLQSWEAWRQHGAWITEHRPRFAPAIAARFDAASRVSADQAAEAQDVLARFRAELRSALGSAVAVLPTAEGPAPRRGEDAAVVDAVRARTMRLTCPAGLAGLPQVTLPFTGRDGLPRGVSVLGGAGTDTALIELAANLERA